MKHLMICDIQPEYASCFRRKFKIEKFTRYLNHSVRSYGRVTYFYNGYDTVGMIKEDDLITWLLDNGLWDIVLPSIHFFDKGYGFVRNPMDMNVPHESIMVVLRYMVENGLSFDDLEEHYQDLVDNEVIHFSGCIPIIKESPFEIMFTGGSTEACLLELEIVAKAFNKKYTLLNKFTYC